MSVANDALAAELQERLRTAGHDPLPEIAKGREGMLGVAMDPDVEILVSAAVGVVGLEATYAAVCWRYKQGSAFRNKEVLVAAGELVIAAAQKSGVALLAWVDSEHNAIHPMPARRAVQTKCGDSLFDGLGRVPFARRPWQKVAAATPKEGFGSSQLGNGAAHHNRFGHVDEQRIRGH